MRVGCAQRVPPLYPLSPGRVNGDLNGFLSIYFFLSPALLTSFCFLLFRGLTPPGPHLFLNNKKVKLFDTYYSNINSHLIVGEWNVKDNILNIGCKKGILLAKFIQFEGKNKISIKDFNNMNLNKKKYDREY